jgi:hypothetical protein
MGRASAGGGARAAQPEIARREAVYIVERVGNDGRTARPGLHSLSLRGGFPAPPPLAPPPLRACRYCGEEGLEEGAGSHSVLLTRYLQHPSTAPGPDTVPVGARAL